MTSQLPARYAYNSRSPLTIRRVDESSIQSSRTCRNSSARLRMRCPGSYTLMTRRLKALKHSNSTEKPQPEVQHRYGLSYFVTDNPIIE